MCYCNTGYIGASCETEWATKFVGSFAAVTAADCQKTYPSDILRTDLLKLSIRNLGGYIGTSGCTNYTVVATITSNTHIHIDDTFCTDFHITGEGDYDLATKKLTIEYNCIYNNGNTTEHCTVVYPF
jgi:hypothetical protein